MSYDNRNRGGDRNFGRDRGGPTAAVNHKTMTLYYDDKGHLKKDVFIDWPKQLAEQIRVSRTNMRRTFDHVSAMRFRIRMGEPAEAVLKPGIGELYRFAEYQAARDRNWTDAKVFIQAHCNEIGHDPKKFEGFFQLFQSLMAYLRRN